MQIEIKEKIKEFQNQLNETNIKLENLTVRRHQLEGAIYSLQNLLSEMKPTEPTRPEPTRPEPTEPTEN